MSFDLITTLQELDLHPEEQPKDTKLDQLEQSVLNGEITNDKEALELLNCSKPYYYELRRKMYDRLIDRFILVGKKGNELADTYIQLYKQFAVFKALKLKRNHQLAISFGENLLSEAKKYEITDLIIGLLREICYFYSYTKHSKIELVLNDLRDYSDDFIQEIKLESIFLQFAHRFTDKIEITAEDLAFSRQIEQSTKAISPSGVFRIPFMYYYIICCTKEIQNDLIGVLKYTDEAIQFFSKKDQSILPYAVRLSFYFRAIPALIKLEKYEVVDSYIIKCHSIIPRKNRDYFLLQVYQTISYFHQEAYEKAWQVLESVKNKHQLNAMDFELFLILKAFAAIFTQRRVMIWKTINDLPIFNQDKKGMNVNVFTVRILYHFSRKELGKIIDMVESLDRYSRRHLNRPDLFRLKNWVKFVINVDRSRYNANMTKIKAAKEIKNLKERPMAEFRTSMEQEPIPYHQLVDFVLERLK